MEFRETIEWLGKLIVYEEAKKAAVFASPRLAGGIDRFVSAGGWRGFGMVAMV
jgi:hypothetical protein